MAHNIERQPGLGFGHQTGPLRPDWGESWADLQCDVCEATWTGPIGEECNYCLRWLELAQETQRQHLLWPELPDHQDERRDQALQTWAKRLAAAELENIITQREAQTAWKRRVPDVAV